MMKIVVSSLVGLSILGATGVIGAQSLTYNSGQNVAPAYEGWEQDSDGTKYFVFGYMNRNWQEELDISAGPANGFSPGNPDRGQPTHFLPRRNIFVFRVKVPDGFSATDELTWTLTSHGVTERAHASLREDYKIDTVVRASETGALGAGSSSPESRANKPPTVTVASKTASAKVGQPIALEATIADDGIPKPRLSLAGRGAGAASAGRAGGAAGGGAAGLAAVLGGGASVGTAASPLLNAVLGPPARITVGKNAGLHLSWVTYRAPAHAPVDYEPSQIKAWQDTRAGANSPWAPIWIAPPIPADGNLKVRVTFPKPGTYILRALADDGSLTSHEDVTVTVTN